MIVALAGLHGSGKSHLAKHLATSSGWQVCVKRELLKQLHETSKVGGDWVEWYRSLYSAEGVRSVTARLLDILPRDKRLILDSVHNLDEWSIIQEAEPDAVLALVVAPGSARAERNGLENPQLDANRIAFWHSGEASHRCLAASSQWCFNGAASAEIQLLEFRSLLSHYGM